MEAGAGMEAGAARSLRVIDANLNRARESLRVIEESARFLAESGSLSRRLKEMRHALTSAQQRLGLDPGALLAARDTAADVGTAHTTVGERDRANSADIRRAAFNRLSEALRVLEEYAKLGEGDASAAFKNLRYECYGVEQAFDLRAPLLKRLYEVTVCLLFTEALCRGNPLKTLHAAIDGGVSMVQLREKDLADGVFLERARKWRALCAERGALFVINDRADVALLCEADGVHLGQRDFSTADARRILGEARMVGMSAHTPEEAGQALSGDVDSLGAGPMFSTRTKPGEPVRGPDLLRRVMDMRPCVPVFAIGGITPGNAATLREAGARRVAVSRSILRANDPREAAERLVEALA